jgi:hypothetical protein
MTKEAIAIVYTVNWEKSGERKTRGPFKSIKDASDLAALMVSAGSHNVRIVVEDYANSDYALTKAPCVVR